MESKLPKLNLDSIYPDCESVEFKEYINIVYNIAKVLE